MTSRCCQPVLRSHRKIKWPLLLFKHQVQVSNPCVLNIPAIALRITFVRTQKMLEWLLYIKWNIATVVLVNFCFWEFQHVFRRTKSCRLNKKSPNSWRAKLKELSLLIRLSNDSFYETVLLGAGPGAVIPRSHIICSMMLFTLFHLSFVCTIFGKGARMGWCVCLK